MSNSAAASGSSGACSALSYEREMPQVSGSLRTNFIAFGFGVAFDFGDLGHRVRRPLSLRARASDPSSPSVDVVSDRIERGMQRMPRQDRALHARRQVAHAGEDREPAEVMRPAFDVSSLPVAMSRNSWISCSASATGLALHRRRHHRRRRLADRARLAFEGDRRRSARPSSFTASSDVVAAQRIEAFGLVASRPSSVPQFRGLRLWSRITSW